MIIDNFRYLLHPKGFYSLIGGFLLICLLFNFSNFVFCELPAEGAESATQKVEQAIIKGELEDFNKAIEKLIAIVKLPGSGGEHAVYVRFLKIIELLRNLKGDRYCFLRALKKLGCELEKRNVKLPVELKKLEEITGTSEFVNLPIKPDKPDVPVVDSVVPLQIDNLPRPLENTTITSNKHILNLKKASYFLISAILLALGIGNKRLIDYLRQDAERRVWEAVEQAQLEKQVIEDRMSQLVKAKASTDVQFAASCVKEAADQVLLEIERRQEAEIRAQEERAARQEAEKDAQLVREEYDEFFKRQKEFKNFVEEFMKEADQGLDRAQKAETELRKVEEELRKEKNGKKVTVV